MECSPSNFYMLQDELSRWLAVALPARGAPKGALLTGTQQQKHQAAWQLLLQSCGPRRPLLESICRTAADATAEDHSLVLWLTLGCSHCWAHLLGIQMWRSGPELRCQAPHPYQLLRLCWQLPNPPPVRIAEGPPTSGWAEAPPQPCWTLPCRGVEVCMWFMLSVSSVVEVLFCLLSSVSRAVQEPDSECKQAA